MKSLKEQRNLKGSVSMTHVTLWCKFMMKAFYQYSPVVDRTDREVVAACSPAHCEPSPAVWAREIWRRRRKCRGVVQGSNWTVVWYRRSQWGCDWWTVTNRDGLIFQSRWNKNWEKNHLSCSVLYAESIWSTCVENDSLHLWSLCEKMWYLLAGPALSKITSSAQSATTLRWQDSLAHEL